MEVVDTACALRMTFIGSFGSVIYWDMVASYRHNDPNTTKSGGRQHQASPAHFNTFSSAAASDRASCR